MQAPSWSIGLLGVTLAGTALAQTTTSEHADAMPAFGAERSVELPGGIRLNVQSTVHAAQAGLCIAFSAVEEPRDWSRQATALVDLDSRLERIEVAFAKAASANAAWQKHAQLHADTATVCLGVPESDLNAALVVLLEGLRNTRVTAAELGSALGKWHNHEGLARLTSGDQEPAQRAEALAWLGGGAEDSLLAGQVSQILGRGLDHWLPTPAIGWRISLSAVSSLDLNDMKSAVLAQPAVRQYSRGRGIAPPTKVSVPAQRHPRFARMHVNGGKTARVTFAWPLPNLGGYCPTAETVAHWLQKHLSAQKNDGPLVAASLRAGQGFGTLMVTVQPPPGDTLDSVEKRLWSAIDRLQSGALGTADLLGEPVSATGDATSLVLDQARHWAEFGLVNCQGNSSRTGGSTTVAGVQQLVKLYLTRQGVSELVSEPRASNAASSVRPASGHAPRAPAGAVQYAVQPGESLRSIARKFRTNIADLLAINHLPHPDQIAPGTKIWVPRPSVAGGSAHQNR